MSESARQKVTCWQGNGERNIFTVWECSIALLVEQCGALEVKRTAIEPINPTSGFLPTENELSVSKRSVAAHVYCSVVHSRPGRESAEVFIDINR